MAQKIYASLQEIDNDLKVLKLKKEIDVLCLKSDYDSLLRNLSVRSFVTEVLVRSKNAILEKPKSVLGLGGALLLRYLVKRK